MNHFIPVAIAALGLFPMAATAADDALDAGNTSGHLSIHDAEFIRKATQGGMAEVKLGGLAAHMSKREDVKAFGERMVADHTNLDDTLKTLALKNGIALQDQLDPTHGGEVDRISTLEGDQFDKAYIEEMIKDHKGDVEEFEQEAKLVKDRDLKDFVAKALPILKKHLQQIEKVANSNP